MAFLTVYTPTYNRRHTLPKLYESLLGQTSQDFEWIVVDDGSTDDSISLLKQWQSEAPFKIKVFRKENGGLHTGYNVAIANTDTELCVCCDSDDYMPPNAVETILRTWKEKGGDHLAGIIGLDYIAGTDTPIGGLFSDTSRTYHFRDLAPRLGHHGDMKMVHRTQLLKPHVPMPTLHGEKNFNPIYIFMQMDESLEYILINENLCNVDYQPDGMTANTFRQYRNSPYSFAELRKMNLKSRKVSTKRKFIEAAHLVSGYLFAKDAAILRGASHKWLIALAFPAGILLNTLIRLKTR